MLRTQQEWKERTMFGCVPRTKQFIATNNDVRKNTLLLGGIGTGKTSTLKLMIKQDITYGRGFMVLDNHGLGKDVLKMIPPSKRDRVIYIGMETIYKFGKTLRFNPLECDDPIRIPKVADNFTECLAKAFPNSWGDRISTCVRDGATAVLGTNSNNIATMTKLFMDADFRQSFLPQIKNQTSRTFFMNFDQNYAKESIGTLYNKLSRLLSTPEIREIFNTTESRISFKDIIRKGLYCIVDLSGIDGDFLRFAGNMFLHMFYMAYKQEERKDLNNTEMFSLYVDEVHMYQEDMIRELLNTVRKYKIKMTIATQTTTSLGAITNEIVALCNTVGCFQCDKATADALKQKLACTVDEIQNLPRFHFSFCYEDHERGYIKNILKTMPIEGQYDPEELEKYTIDQWGEEVNLLLMQETSNHVEAPLPPLPFYILNLLRKEKRPISLPEIQERVQKKFEVGTRDVAEVLRNKLMSTNGFVTKETKQNPEDMKTVTYYKITETGITSIFNQAAAGRGAGGDLHLGTIFNIMDQNNDMDKFCVPDLGKHNKGKPDLLIFTPVTHIKGEDQDVMYSTVDWSSKVVAVEVETDPGKHLDQIVKNFEKNQQWNYYPEFVVFNRNDQQKIIAKLREKGIPDDEYTIRIFDERAIMGNTNNEHSYRTSIETAIVSLVQEDSNYTTAAITRRVSDFIEAKREDIIEALNRLDTAKVIQKKGDNDKEYWQMSPLQDQDKGFLLPSQIKAMKEQGIQPPQPKTEEPNPINPNEFLKMYTKMKDGTKTEQASALMIKKSLSDMGYEIRGQKKRLQLHKKKA